MGTLFCGASRWPITIEDRLLTHLKVVVLARQRRHEATVLNWQDGADVGGGRTTVRIDQTTELLFHFAGGKRPELDRELVENLANQATTATGIDLSEAGTLATRPRYLA